MIHTFSGNPIDRADAIRRNEDDIDSLLNKSNSVFLLFKDLKVLIATSNQTTELKWLPSIQLSNIKMEANRVFLGLINEIAYFAVDILKSETIAPILDSPEICFTDCRIAAMSLPQEQTGMLAQARSQLEWHRKHQFCGICGQKTKSERGGYLRRCTSCDAASFPRTDPVVIMLVTKGEYCLLGKPVGPFSKTNLYTALAGFVDQGESIEEAVKREVMEESGVIVENVEYHSSQPWPFPYSLMIGCYAMAKTEGITIDHEELADAAWFSKTEVADALHGNKTILEIPGPIAIAHHLMKAWALQETR
jgi:NAD+ diphosphatase